LGRRRGFFAELQYLNQQAEKQRRQQEAAASRARVAAQREAERASRVAERAKAAAIAASVRDRDRLEKESIRLHVESRMAEAASLNAALAQSREEIDGMLAATLAVDDAVDLEALKITRVDHPLFDPGPYGIPNPPVPVPVYPPEPVYYEPPPPGGLIGAKKKHAELIAFARLGHEQALRAWHDQCRGIHAAHVTATGRREEAERLRLGQVSVLQAKYRAECQQRESEAEARNQAVTKLINDLAFDVESAIQEYVGIVLSNSVYPEAFPVDHDYEFDLATRELRLTVTVPAPSALSVVKEYRYVKVKDEITSTSLPVKAQKDQYTGAIAQVAVRTLHEVFEADRGGKIHSIALTVGTDVLSPATGLRESVPLVIVAADRETFSRFDLSNVVPQATLEHLGGAMSRSPFDLTPADTSRGVRVRKQ
jgi:restriction system protein